MKNPAAHEMVTTHDAARVPHAFVNKTPNNDDEELAWAVILGHVD